MRAALACPWSGVFPAATTQFDAAGNVDLAATRAVQAALLRDGVHGLVLLGTVGENNSLSAEEKRAVLSAAVETVGGKVPLITGVSEYTTAGAAAYARDAERIGVTGLMVLPAMVYVPTSAEPAFQGGRAGDRAAHHAVQQSARLSRQHRLGDSRETFCSA